MNKQNYDDLQKEVDVKAEKRGKKRACKMKVSGAGVKKLQRLIMQKSNLKNQND